MDWRAGHTVTERGREVLLALLDRIHSSGESDWESDAPLTDCLREELARSPRADAQGWIPARWFKVFQEFLSGDVLAEKRWVTEVVSLAGKLALADDKLDPREADHLRGWLDSIAQEHGIDLEWTHDPESAARFVRSSEEISVSKALNVPETEREDLLAQLFELAAADKKFQHEEVKLLKAIATNLRIADSSFNNLVEQFQSRDDIDTQDLEQHLPPSDEELLDLLM